MREAKLTLEQNGKKITIECSEIAVYRYLKIMGVSANENINHDIKIVSVTPILKKDEVVTSKNDVWSLNNPNPNFDNTTKINQRFSMVKKQTCDYFGLPYNVKLQYYAMKNKYGKNDASKIMSYYRIVLKKWKENDECTRKAFIVDSKM